MLVIILFHLSRQIVLVYRNYAFVCEMVNTRRSKRPKRSTATVKVKLPWLPISSLVEITGGWSEQKSIRQSCQCGKLQTGQE